MNWARDGLDGGQNIVPLCRICNRLMPVFDNGPAAIARVTTRGGWLAAFEEWMEKKYGPD